jgi:hypothetical protein
VKAALRVMFWQQSKRSLPSKQKYLIHLIPSFDTLSPCTSSSTPACLDSLPITTTMGSRSSSIPDSVTPYCRELFDRLQTDIEDVSERRDAIIWIAELFLMEQTQACKLLEAREKRIVSTIATATEKAIIQDNQEIIDLTPSSEDEEERGQCWIQGAHRVCMLTEMQ